MNPIRMLIKQKKKFIPYNNRNLLKKYHYQNLQILYMLKLNKKV